MRGKSPQPQPQGGDAVVSILDDFIHWITENKAAFSWAVQNFWLDRNPIEGIKKPEAKRRRDIVVPGEFEKMLALVGEGCFRDLLTVSYD